MVFKQSERSAKMWWRHGNIHVLLHVRATGDSPVSFGDDTHAVVKRPTWA